MTIQGLAYVTKRKPGKPVRHYIYAWRGGPCILSVTGGTRPKLTPEAVAAYHEAISARKSPSVDTLAGLCAAWRASPEWRAFAKTTQHQWGMKLAAIEEKWGGVPLVVFDDRRMKGKIIAWRDGMAEYPRKADYSITVLRSLLSFGRLRGLLALNIAEGIPGLYKGGNRAAIIWEPIERYVMELGLSVPVSDAFRLACLTGFRRSDLTSVPLHAVGDHAIVWATQKSGRTATVTVPMIPPLKALIEELHTRFRLPGVASLLVNSRGQQWTPDGLNSSFGDERDRLGFDKHMHDCRGTFVTELCEAGLTDAQVAGIVGWAATRVADVRRIYVDQARTVVAIGERLASRIANHSANRSG